MNQSVYPLWLHESQPIQRHGLNIWPPQNQSVPQLTLQHGLAIPQIPNSLSPQNNIVPQFVQQHGMPTHPPFQSNLMTASLANLEALQNSSNQIVAMLGEQMSQTVQTLGNQGGALTTTHGVPVWMSGQAMFNNQMHSQSPSMAAHLGQTEWQMTQTHAQSVEWQVSNGKRKFNSGLEMTPAPTAHPQLLSSSTPSRIPQLQVFLILSCLIYQGQTAKNSQYIFTWIHTHSSWCEMEPPTLP
eukprot:9482082-Pyramimonas_sp.AAC.1